MACKEVSREIVLKRKHTLELDGTFLYAYLQFFSREKGGVRDIFMCAKGWGYGVDGERVPSHIFDNFAM